MPDTKQGSAAAAPAAATPEPLAAILAEMRDEPSPRPWRVEENVVGWSSFIVDANGDGVAACWRTARGDDEKERQYNEANAALIVAAVNERAKFEEAHMKFPDLRPVIIAAGQRDAAVAERDRLRDLVRRFADLSESLLANYEYRYREDVNSMAFVENTRGFLREARTAIGEDAP